MSRASYDAIAAEWCAVRTRLPRKDAALFERFFAALPPKGDVLDLGCGSGLPVARLLCDRGLRVTGVDQSAKLLDAARQNVPEAELFEADLLQYRPVRRFHGIVFWDVLFHFPRESHRRILEGIYGGLEPGGLAILSSGGSEDDLEPFTDTMFGVEFFYDAYPIDAFLELCQHVGFVVVHYERVNLPDGGRDKGRIGVILERD